jgi:3-phenylpropionate/trans-cinnamate dioxygenase ferredoxin subunit
MEEVFVKVGKLSAIPEGKSKRVTVGDEELALWRVRGKIYAVNNVCAHQHIAALHQGILEGLLVSCPMHGWTYSLETGKAISGGGSVKTYAVKVVGDDILVECPG